MDNNISYYIAFINGILAFFTPCIIPLLPVYFGYLSGEAASNIHNSLRKKLILNALGFVSGLSFVNLLLGFGAKAFSNLLGQSSYILRISGGILMILFGLYFILGFQWMPIERERRFELKGYSPNFLKSFLLGITFSFGWMPCTGPVITNILFMASFQQDFIRAGTLMLTYSLGFSVMFLLSALLVSQFINKIKNIYKHLRKIKVISGVVMIIMGILVLTNILSIFNQFLN